MRKKIDRRTFFGSTLAGMFSTSLGNSLHVAERNIEYPTDPAPEIIDTNVHLLEWPFRKLKYGDTSLLVEKLRKHRIKQAWAGSYESLFHKDIDGVNARLFEECKRHGAEMLLPFGTVNIAWPDWEEDLRRCHEKYKMPGIRIYPGYQTFDLDHPDFFKFMEMVSSRRLILQIVGDMEDVRVHHPIMQVRKVNILPLIENVKKIPPVKVQLLYWNHQVEGKQFEKLITETNILLDTSRLESTGAIGRLIDGNSWNGLMKPVAIERILFGSHAPYFPVETNVLKLFESPLSLLQMQAIMSGNASRFLST